MKSSVAHGYDNAGRRKYAQYEDNLGQAYNYDSAGQVKNVLVNTSNPATASATVAPTHSYNYDANGNRNSALAFGATTSYTANSVNAYTAITNSAAPTYDLNGNMLTGPVDAVAATLDYDKENRLRNITRSGVTTSYTYDALSRIVQTITTAATDNRERYTWSGWTLLSREIFTGTTPTSTFRYTWGLDLSGSMEGAGGVGGLLAIERNVTGNTTWDIRYAHNDANGNIIALTDSSGNVSARYRYDAFGNTLSATDVDSSGWVNHNIHRFSTKPTLGNTGLHYYGYRWYNAKDGRWINRDPIEERGGRNMYGFVGNDGVNDFDLLGLYEWESRLKDYEIQYGPWTGYFEKVEDRETIEYLYEPWLQGTIANMIEYDKSKCMCNFYRKVVTEKVINTYAFVLWEERYVWWVPSKEGVKNGFVRKLSQAIERTNFIDEWRFLKEKSRTKISEKYEHALALCGSEGPT